MLSRTYLLGIMAVVGLFFAAPLHADPLYDAAAKGDIEEVNRLIAQGADVNAKEKRDDQTALIIASHLGHGDIVSLLLSNGADVNAQMFGGATALFIASQSGHGEVVSLLLSSGAEVNTTTNNGSTALISASQNGHGEIVSLLLSSGADVNAQHDNGATALFIASLSGHGDIVSLLLSNGADVNAQHDSGASALFIATQKGHGEIVGLLLSNGADVNTTANNGWTALLMASGNGHGEIVSLLLSNGADVTHPLADGRTALEVASERGHQAVVQVLGGAPKSLKVLEEEYLACSGESCVAEKLQLLDLSHYHRISEYGVEGRLVIPDSRWTTEGYDGQIRITITANSESEYILHLQASTDVVQGHGVGLWGNKSIIRFDGPVRFPIRSTGDIGGGWLTHGTVRQMLQFGVTNTTIVRAEPIPGALLFEGDPENVLAFMLLDDVGFVYLHGTGTVHMADGTVVSLPMTE